jgi:hypothetical protein
MPFKVEEVINRINEIEFITPKKNDIVPNQLIGQVKLNGKMLDIQCPFTKQTHGGFAQKGNIHYVTPTQRANSYNYPLEKDSEMHQVLIKLQETIIKNQDILVPEEMKGKIEVQDMVREYDNPKKDVTEYSFKVRVALKIKDLKNEEYDIETAFWKKESKTSKEKPVPIIVKTVDDVEKIIKYGSEVQMIIRLNKMYISTKNEGTKKDPKYKMGVTFKMMAVQVINNSAINTVDYKNINPFDNNGECDDDDDDDDMKAGGPVINTDNIDTSNLDDLDINEEDEEDE